MASNLDCGMLLKQITDSITKCSNQDLRKNDLTLSQIRYLSFLRERFPEKVALKDIEAYFGVAQPTVAGIMARMVKKGLVIQEADPNDARAKTASLTEKGMAVCQDSKRSRENTEKRLLAPLSQEEQVLFRELLNRVNNGLKEI